MTSHAVARFVDEAEGSGNHRVLSNPGKGPGNVILREMLAEDDKILLQPDDIAVVP